MKENTPALEILDHLFRQGSRKPAVKSRQYKTFKWPVSPYRKTLDDFDFELPGIHRQNADHGSGNHALCPQQGERGVPRAARRWGKRIWRLSLGIIAASNRFTTYYVNCHSLIDLLNKAHYENRLPEKLKQLSKYSVLIIDEIGYLPMDVQGANLFFQLITKRYEKNTTIFTSNKPFSQWNEVFSDMTIAAAILDRVLHHCNVINIRGESYRLKERKEHMKATKKVNTLFENE